MPWLSMPEGQEAYLNEFGLNNLEEICSSEDAFEKAQGLFDAFTDISELLKRRFICKLQLCQNINVYAECEFETGVGGSSVKDVWAELYSSLEPGVYKDEKLDMITRTDNVGLIHTAQDHLGEEFMRFLRDCYGPVTGLSKAKMLSRKEHRGDYVGAYRELKKSFKNAKRRNAVPKLHLHKVGDKEIIVPLLPHHVMISKLLNPKFADRKIATGAFHLRDVEKEEFAIGEYTEGILNLREQPTDSIRQDEVAESIPINYEGANKFRFSDIPMQHSRDGFRIEDAKAAHTGQS